MYVGCKIIHKNCHGEIWKALKEPVEVILWSVDVVNFEIATPQMLLIDYNEDLLEQKISLMTC